MVQVDFLVLADYAEAINGKAYIVGGGWDRYTVNTAFPARLMAGVAVGFRVAWDETNRAHPFRVIIQNEDTQETVASVDGQFETGRPAGIVAGQDQFVPICVNLPVEVRGPGEFSIRLALDEREVETRAFRVVRGPMAPAGGNR